MTAQDLKNSILQLAVQGKLVQQNPSDASINLNGIRLKRTDEYEFEIPNSWKSAHLEAITIVMPSKQYQILESEVKQSGKYSVISQSKAYSIGFTDDESKIYHHEKPVVVFGDHTTEVKYIDFDFVVGADGVKIFEPIDKVVIAKYLFYVLQFYSRDLNKVGGYSRHYKYIKNKPIPLPPLAEQKRIVAKIEELMPLVEEYGKAEEQLTKPNAEFPDKLRKSILQQAVQGKLTERDPADESASELLKRIKTEKEALMKSGKIKKEKPLPEIKEEEKPFDIPDTWEWVRLKNLIFSLTDGTHSTPQYTASGIHFISVKDVSSGKLSFDNTKYISLAEHNELKKRCNPQKGDILLTKVGTTGIPVLIESDIKFSLFVSVALLKFSHENIFPKYFIYLLKSPLVQEQAAKNTRGVGNKNWVLSDIEKTILVLPPLAEQKRIVKRVEELLALCDELKGG